MTQKPPRDASVRPTLTPAAGMALGLSIATLMCLAALHVVSPQFDPSWRMVSEYALGSYGWLLSVMFGCWAASTWALATAIRSQLRTRRGRVGLTFLVLAGVGEAMASIFDITHDLGHGIAGVLGVGCLPVAAVLISAAPSRDANWAGARKPLRWLAALTWLAVAAFLVTLTVMTVQVAHAYGGQLPQVAPATLPAGVLRLDGWADRLIVAANCIWVAAVAGRAMIASGRKDRRPLPGELVTRLVQSPKAEHQTH